MIVKMIYTQFFQIRKTGKGLKISSVWRGCVSCGVTLNYGSFRVCFVANGSVIKPKCTNKLSLYCVQEQKEPVSSVSECKRDGELSTLRLRLCIDIADGCNTGARSKMSLER